MTAPPGAALAEASTATIAARMLRLAGPVALARLGVMGFALVDTIVVGRLAAAELPYIGLGHVIPGVFLMSGIGLMTGVQVLAARALGAGRPLEAGAAWRGGLMMALLAGLAGIALTALIAGPSMVLFGVAPELAGPSARVAFILALSIPFHLVYVACAYFMEALERPAASALVIAVANLLNLAVNLWLVPGMGAEGSAWATVASRALLAVGMVGWVWASARARACGARALGRGPDYRALLGVGVAAAASLAIEGGAFGGMTVIAGRIGPEAVGAYQIVLNILSVVFMMTMGVAAATAVLVAEAAGAGRIAAAGRIGWLGLGLNSGFMILCALVLGFFPAAIIGVYTADPGIAAAAAATSLAAALALIPDGGQFVAASALRARGDNWFPTASHIAAYAVVMPALALFLAEGLGRGTTGLLEAILVASVLSVAVLAARFAWLTRAV